MTEHFKLEEFLKSNTAKEKGIDNTPNEEQLDNLKFVAEQLELIRLAYNNKPMFITSGFRSEELNKAIGGAKKSQHMQGLAVDINQGSPRRNHNLFLIIKRMMKVGLPVGQLIDEKKYSWIHVSFEPNNPRLQVLHLK